MQFKTFFSGITKTSISFLILALLLFVYSVFCEISIYSESPIQIAINSLNKNSSTGLSNPLLDTYVKAYNYVWYLSLLCILFGTFKSFARSFLTTNHLITQLALSAFLALSFLVLSMIHISRLPSADSGHYTVVIGLFSVMSVCVGWLINTQVSRRYEEKNEQITKRNYKRSHTLNVIIKVRLSQDLQDRIEDIMKCYSLTGGPIPQEDVQAYFKRDKSSVAAESSEDLLKYKAIQSSIFLLDLYEFICEGVAQDDLDEEVVYESIFGSILRNRNRAIHLIDAIRKGTYSGQPSPKALIQLVAFTDKHKVRYEQEKAAIMAEMP